MIKVAKAYMIITKQTSYIQLYVLDLKKQYVYILLLVLGKILVKFFIGKQEEGGRYSIYIYSIYFINTPFIVLLFLVFWNIQKSW